LTTTSLLLVPGTLALSLFSSLAVSCALGGTTTFRLSLGTALVLTLLQRCTSSSSVSKSSSGTLASLFSFLFCFGCCFLGGSYGSA